MMMYGDSAIEEELEDLGDEFAAQCAANSIPSVSGAVMHQEFYNVPTTSSPHLMGGDMYYQQAEPQGAMYMEHSYAQVHEPAVMQRQYQEIQYNDPMTAQHRFSPQILVTSSQSVHQPYDQVMYTNGHCYAQEEPVYQQVSVNNGPVIQQVFEPVQLMPAVTQPMEMAQQVQQPMAPQSELPRARIIARVPPPLPGRQFQGNQPFRRVENPVPQHQPQQQPQRMLNKPVPEGVRVLRQRVVGRPLIPPVSAADPQMPLLQAHAPVTSTSFSSSSSSSLASLSDPTPSPAPVMEAVVAKPSPTVTAAPTALPTPGAINKLPPIPKKKRPEAAPPVVASVSSTEVAQAGAIQRIATEEGWKKMNEWLKTADKENKLAHLKDLLRQCHQANISVQLLTSNDSPKFVRKLSKTHADSDVRQAALACVTKWKKEIADPTVPAPAKKAKKEEPVEEKEQPSAKASKTEAKDSAKKAEKRRLSDEAAKSAEKSSEKAEKKNKTKAKVFSSKSRLTGLVEDLGESGPEAKKKKKEAEGGQKKAADGGKKKEDEAPAKKAEQPVVKKLPPIPKKVSASSMSSGFMDALSVSIEPRKKPAPKRRAEHKKEKPVVNDPLSSVFDCLIGDKKVEPPRVTKTPTPPPVPLDDPDTAPPGNRKIRFADECGKELTSVREFQIEEGERINVNRMSAEDMKHHEAMMERKWKEESGEPMDEPEEEEPVKEKIPWRLLPIDNLTWPIEHGNQSEEKDKERERRKTALRAFNHPNFPSEITGDPEDYDPVAARMHVPPIIPLNSIEEAGQETPAIPVQEPPKQEEKKITLPDNLQNLLDGLKKKGIVSGGPGPATPAATTLASMVSGLSSLAMFGGNGAPAAPAPVQIPQNNPYGQVINATREQQPHIHQQMPPQNYGQFGQYPHHQQERGPHHQQERNHQQERGQHQQHHMDVDRRMGMHQPGPSSGPPRGPHANANNQCHQWSKMGRCTFGDRCRFAHDNIPGAAPSFRGGRGGFRGRGDYGGWRGDDRRGGYRNHGPPRRDYHDRRGYDSPPYASPSMHSPQITSPSIRSPPGGSTPNDFGAVAIPSERLD